MRCTFSLKHIASQETTMCITQKTKNTNRNTSKVCNTLHFAFVLFALCLVLYSKQMRNHY